MKFCTTQLGEHLKEICSFAREELIIAAPFLKLASLSRLLERVEKSVALTIVTRWHADEIHCGVSDIEVYELVARRGNFRFLLRQNIHAKYYRSDANIVIGSANVTHSALGWRNNENLEVLVSGYPHDQFVKSFEADLLARSIPVTDKIYADFQSLKNILLSCGQKPNRNSSDVSLEIEFENVDPQCWVPQTRTPENLFKVYTGQNDSVVDAEVRRAESDIFYLKIPHGLDEVSFNKAVGSVFLLQPIISEIDSVAIHLHRFGHYVNLLLERRKNQSVTKDSSKRDLQTIYRWLCYFLPNRFEIVVRNHSEMIHRIS